MRIGLILAFLTLTGSAQTPQPNRVPDSPDLTRQVVLPAQLPAWVAASRDVGPAPNAQPISNVILVLTRPPAVEAAFQQLLLDQHNPASPRFRQWLTPQQTGDLYGVSLHDLNLLTSWLTAQGLTVDDISASRLFVTVSGDAATVSHAFATEIHNFSTVRGTLYAATHSPSIPAAFAPLLRGFVGLSQQLQRPHSHKLPGTFNPQVDLTNGVHALLPADFATIYDIAAVYSAGITGSGQRIAILGASRITPSDITAYESLAALPSTQPTTIIVPGFPDPGATGNGQGGAGDAVQVEATLDVDRVIGTAPGAAVDLLLAATNQNLTDAGIIAAINYNTSTLNDPILNISFGRCEIPGDDASAASFNAAIAAGVAQGTSFFVASGDSEVTGCADAGSSYADSQAASALGPSTNILCGPYVTCVGGTQFSDTTRPSAYWAPTNGAGYGSALSYIPEGVWNEPVDNLQNSQGVVTSTAYVFLGAGGGPSIFNPKPAWQTGTGVPADGVRDTPDISFSSSGHNGYVLCAAFSGANCSPYLALVSGTSAAAPSMAGIAALLNQKLADRLGNLNPLLYELAATPSNHVIHDATLSTSGTSPCSLISASTCNSSTPGPTGITGGISGFALTAGFDSATGLGSLDVANLLASAAIPPTLAVTTDALTGTSGSITTQQTATYTSTISSTHPGTPTGTVQFYRDSTTSLGSPITLSAGVAVLPPVTLPTGSHTITSAYSGDSNFAASTSNVLSVSVGVTPTSLAQTPSRSTLNTLQSQTFTATVSSTSSGTPTGTVQFSVDGVTKGSPVALTGLTALSPAFNFSVGTHLVTAAYPGDTSFAASTSPSASITVTAVTPTVLLSLSPTSITPIQNSNAAITVTGPSGAPAPTGSVSLNWSSMVISTQALVNGSATLLVSPSPSVVPGVYQLFGTYSGDALYASSLSPAANLTVTAAAVRSFTIAPSPASITLSAGALSGNSSSLTFNSVNNFSGNLATSCLVTYTGSGTQSDLPTCTLSPAFVPLTTTATATLTLVSTSSSTAALRAPTHPVTGPRFLRGMALASFFLVFLPRRSRRRLRRLTLLPLVLALLSSAGCGLERTAAIPTPALTGGTTPGLYTVTVTATGGTLTASTSIALTIQ